MSIPDFDRVRRLCVRAKDRMYPAQADEADTELSDILPPELEDALRDLDPRGDEFERVFDGFFEKAQTAKVKAKGAKQYPCVGFPDYEIRVSPEIAIYRVKSRRNGQRGKPIAIQLYKGEFWATLYRFKKAERVNVTKLAVWSQRAEYRRLKASEVKEAPQSA